MPAYHITDTPNGFLLHEPPAERLRTRLLATLIVLGLPAIGGIIAWFDRNVSAMRVWAWLALFILAGGLMDFLHWQTLEVDTRRRVLVLRRTRLGRWGVRESRLPFDAVGEVMVKPFTRFVADATPWTPLNARLKVHTRDGRRWATFEFHRVAPAEAAGNRLRAALNTSKAIQESGARS